MTATTPTESGPFDLDAARAARAEATGERFAFTSHGESYTMPGPKDWPVQVTAALSKGDLEGALTQLLGPEDTGRFLGGGPVTMGDLEALFGAVAKWAGVGDLGN